MSNLSTTPKELKALAMHYNTPEFVKSDPVQFPHRYSEKRDIEVSGFVTSWISWGNRKQIIKTANLIDQDTFKGKPFDYLQSKNWTQFENDERCLYRTCKYKDFYSLMHNLWLIYQQYEDLEACIVDGMSQGLNAAEALSCRFRGVAGVADATKSSPCKRLWFFLRWMVRQDGIVDLGIWKNISPSQLIIPLDTHVYHVAQMMGITQRKSADIKTAREITNYFLNIFPDDPVLGDFALFGLGIEKGI